MRSYIYSGWSAATQVKAVSPDIFLFAVGHGLVCPEAGIVADAIRRVCIDLPGSQAAAGHPTDCIGTWDSRIACMPQQAAEVRRGLGDTAVGPAHSRGVAGVMPGDFRVKSLGLGRFDAGYSKGPAVNRRELRK